MITHPIPPFYNSCSKILILGSFPSVKSREAMFFYGHPQNRFWRVIASVIGCNTPNTVDEKKNMLLKNGVALWDVIFQCEIEGSADSTIRVNKVNDISGILASGNIKAIFTNGKKAHELYQKKVFPITKINAVCLPSTSPANAAWSLQRLIDEWSIIKKYI